MGMGSAWVTESAQHSTNVGYVGISCIVTLFEKFYEILVVETAPEFNFLMRNGVPNIGVDPGLKY